MRPPSKPKALPRSARSSTPSPPSSDKRELARALGESLRADVDAAEQHQLSHRQPVRTVGCARLQRLRATTRAYLLQGGLVLPDREYYLADSDRMRDIRAKYQAHVAAMLKARGIHR